MKFSIKLMTVLAILIGSSCAFAGNGPGKHKKGVVHGKVEKIDGSTITILTKGVESTVQTDANTKFYIDDKPATLADVQAKQRLFASAGSGPATEVRLLTKGRKAARTKTNATTVPS